MDAHSTQRTDRGVVHSAGSSIPGRLARASSRGCWVLAWRCGCHVANRLWPSPWAFHIRCLGGSAGRVCKLARATVRLPQYKQLHHQHCHDDRAGGSTLWSGGEPGRRYHVPNWTLCGNYPCRVHRSHRARPRIPLGWPQKRLRRCTGGRDSASIKRRPYGRLVRRSGRPSDRDHGWNAGLCARSTR